MFSCLVIKASGDKNDFGCEWVSECLQVFRIGCGSIHLRRFVPWKRRTTTEGRGKRRVRVEERVKAGSGRSLPCNLDFAWATFLVRAG